MLLRAASAAIALVLLACPAEAYAGDLSTAIQNNDVEALQAVANVGNGPAATLARGVLASLRRQDEDAARMLRAAAEDTTLDASLRRDAWSALSATALRDGRFTEAARDMQAANDTAPARDEHDALAARQSLAFATALANTPAMTTDVPPQGEAALRRDLARLPRADIAINGQTQEAVLDTGANFSTITETIAQRLHLRMLDGDISVGASANDDVPGHLAIADTLVFAGATFHNVVFIVFPDSALSFAHGAYTIPAIVGFPVLSALGRVEWRMDASGAGSLRHRASGQHWRESSNLLLAGLRPIAVVTANGNRVRMTLDSGARNSGLKPLASSEFPALVAGAGARDVSIGGAGGTRTITNAPIIAHLAIGVGAQTVNLSDIHVTGDADDGVHGELGQDVLQSGAGYVIDFDAMRFELLPAN